MTQYPFQFSSSDIAAIELGVFKLLQLMGEDWDDPNPDTKLAIERRLMNLAVALKPEKVPVPEYSSMTRVTLRIPGARPQVDFYKTVLRDRQYED